MNTLTHTILLAEDSPDDAFFMRYALKKAGITYAVHLAVDGEQTINYLMGTGKYSDRQTFPLPTVIFLDLKMPCLSGFEVLTWMRGQPGLSNIPVIILTGSSEDRDKKQACELGARGYYVKPPDATMLRQIMDGLNPQSTRAVAPVILSENPVMPSNVRNDGPAE
jgi:CheY-like chemotaxis protein